MRVKSSILTIKNEHYADSEREKMKMIYNPGEHVIGLVWNEEREKFQCVIGYEIKEPGHYQSEYYQFFEIHGEDNFRKQINTTYDSVDDISEEIYNALKIYTNRNI